MASQRQNEANRNNAARSTGPKTADGKTSSSQNALRHGLARSGTRDPVATETFAVVISSRFEHPVASDSVMALARCKLALLRIRSLRQDMLAALLARPLSADLKRLKGLERYERAALAEQKRTLRSLSLESG
jgi:hypothetical protein